MAEWEAPAKLNLDLRVGAADSAGMHPIRSLVQTLEWCDHLVIEADDDDRLEVNGAEMPDDGDNLVWRAVEALGLGQRPLLDVVLTKRVPVAAGLGGGSSDAAAMLAALAEMTNVDPELVQAAAAAVGADVPYFLTGGTAIAEGYGERITVADRLAGFAVGVAVPSFELSTPEVYRRWDEMNRPTGEELGGSALPPGLRSYGELRNDLTPASLNLRPELGDWMRDLSERWDRPVAMSGSGPACFGFFVDVDEAHGAVAGVADHRAATAADLRPVGVARREE